MDFEDAPQEAAYRQKARNWLAEHAPSHAAPAGGAEPEEAMMRRARLWQKAKSKAGYTGITWPADVGGQGGAPIEKLIFEQEEAQYRVFTIPFQVGMGMCLPTIIATTPPELARNFVEPALRGDEIWCQLFSEPGAGSDLAGVRTRAVRDGSDWVVNGQKVWTSYANHADYGLLLLRTDPGMPKHKGLTMFFVDMRSAGIEVRPIRSMTGHADFNEVFLTDLRIPDSQRLGEIGAGWRVALTTLMHERLAIGRDPDAPGAEELIALARSLPSGREGGTMLQDSAVQAAIARFYINDAGLDFLRMRAQTAISAGRAPGPEASIGKLVMAKTRQDIGAYAMDLMEGGGVLDGAGGALLAAFRYHYMFSAGLRIAGGTDEVLRNIIAERVLGLPGDARSDREKPFNTLDA
jgi:alkylation response protein AidB-like acyl-CoA dehydrogenase